MLPIGGPHGGVSGDDGALPGVLPIGGPHGGVSRDDGALPGVLPDEDSQEEASGDNNPLSNAESERIRLNSSLSIYIFSLSYTIIII